MIGKPDFTFLVIGLVQNWQANTTSWTSAHVGKRNHNFSVCLALHNFKPPCLGEAWGMLKVIVKGSNVDAWGKLLKGVWASGSSVKGAQGRK